MHHKLSSATSLTCACTELRKASRAVTRLYDEALEQKGMTIVQFSILRNLARHGATPLSRLADLLVMERTTLYRALSPLERHGWVSVGEGNGRAKVAVLSKLGRGALATATGAWEGVQTRLMQAVGVRNWKELEESLERIVNGTRAVTGLLE